MDAGFAELYDTSLHSQADASLNMTLKVIPSIAGKKFGCYVLQEIESSEPNVDTYKKSIYPQSSDISLNSSNSTTEDMNVDGVSNSSYVVKKVTTTNSKDITIDFELGVYQNLRMKLKNVQEVDVEYQVFDGVHRIPEINLQGVTLTGDSADLYENVRSRTITYNNVSYVQPSNAAVSEGNANLTFSLTKDLLNSLNAEIQGRDPSTLSFSSSEPVTHMDAFYNHKNDVVGFATDTNANFIEYLSVDENVTLDNSHGYRIMMDINRGSVGTFSLSAKHYTPAELGENLNATTGQDFFALHEMTNVGTSQDLPSLTFDVVVDPSNILTLSADGNVIAKAFTNEKSLMADLMFVTTRGSVFNIEKTLVNDSGATSYPLDSVMMPNSENSINIDSGVHANVTDTNIALSGVTGVWSLKDASVKVKFDARSNTYDFEGRIRDNTQSVSNLIVQHPDFQDINFNAYRGITADQTFTIKRESTKVNFRLNHNGVFSTSTHDLLAGNNMTLNFSVGNALTNVGNIGVVITQDCEFVRFSDAFYSDVSSGNLIITPSQYNIVEFIKQVNGTQLDLTSTDLSNLQLNNLTPTSFDENVLDFYDRKISENEANDVSGGLYVLAKIGVDTTERMYFKSKEQTTVVTTPNGVEFRYRYDVDSNPRYIENTPVILTRIGRELGLNSTFTLRRPQQVVSYRKSKRWYILWYALV